MIYVSTRMAISMFRRSPKGSRGKSSANTISAEASQGSALRYPSAKPLPTARPVDDRRLAAKNMNPARAMITSPAVNATAWIKADGIGASQPIAAIAAPPATGSARLPSRMRIRKIRPRKIRPAAIRTSGQRVSRNCSPPRLAILNPTNGTRRASETRAVSPASRTMLPGETV